MRLERPAPVTSFEGATTTAADGTSQTTQRRRDPEPPISWSGVALVVLAPALGGFLYGYDIGATSFVLTILLRNYKDAGVAHDLWWLDFRHCNWQQGFTVAAVSLGALAGSHLVLFHLAKAVGRRTELRIAAALYVTGTLCNVLSGTLLRSWGAFGFTALILGRFVFGMGVGFVMRTYYLVLLLQFYNIYECI